MDFLRVGQSKLKVILSAEEAGRYDIKSTDAENAGAQVRRSLRRILAEARERVGFDVGAEKVLIQLYPLSEGGYELFATKLGALADKDRRMLAASEGITTYSGGRGIYRFGEFSELLAAMRAIRTKEAECDVYIGEDGEYYISITEHSFNGFSEFEILTEYARRLVQTPHHLLSEHARLLIEGRGIDILSRL